MKTTITLLVLILFAPLAVKAQAKAPDCSAFDNLKSCQTFSQLLAAGDQDFLPLNESPEVRRLIHAGAYDAYVCFEKDDTFFRIGVEQKPKYKPNVLVQFAEFRSGIESDNRFTAARTAPLLGPQIDGPIFSLKKNSFTGLPYDMSFSDLGGEVNIGFKFLNQDNQTTRRAISIRKSILRFRDTFEAPDLDTPLEKTGSCTLYRRAGEK